jgi:hypothetical protein
MNENVNALKSSIIELDTKMLYHRYINILEILRKPLMIMSKKLVGDLIKIDYAYDTVRDKPGEIIDNYEYEGYIYKVKCLSNDYMHSVQWVPGGKAIYKILEVKIN